MSGDSLRAQISAFETCLLTIAVLTLSMAGMVAILRKNSNNRIVERFRLLFRLLRYLGNKTSSAPYSTLESDPKLLCLDQTLQKFYMSKKDAPCL
jgi:hypothetical protein